MYEFLMETEQAGKLMKVCFEMFPVQSISCAVLIFASGYFVGKSSTQERA